MDRWESLCQVDLQRPGKPHSQHPRRKHASSGDACARCSSSVPRSAPPRTEWRPSAWPECGLECGTGNEGRRKLDYSIAKLELQLNIPWILRQFGSRMPEKEAL